MSSIQETFNELRDFITSKDYGHRYPKKPTVANWDKMMTYFETLDPTVAQHVVEYRDDDDGLKRNLMMWALSVKGGPPPKLVESILNVSSEVIKQKDVSDSNYLHYAMQYGSSVKVMKLLINANPKALMEKEYNGHTPLHLGIEYNKLISKEMIQLCVETNPQLAWEKNGDGDTPVHLAIEKNSNQSFEKYSHKFFEIVRIIVNSSPMAMAMLVQDNDGRTPLSYAIEKKSSDEVIDYLFLEASSEETRSEFANRKDNDGNTGLHYSMQYGFSVRIIQYILAANPRSVEEKNDKGDTALHVGIGTNKNISKEVLQLFTEASPKALLLENNDGRIPLLLAMEKNISIEIILDIAKRTIPSHGGNRKVPPEKWGMRLWQANIFSEWLQGTDLWEEVKNRLNKFKKHPYVNGYEVNDEWVKKITAMLGSSLALLLNPILPLLAEIMVSHAWGDDMVEKMQALNSAIPDKDKVIWFCIYANYQPEDGAGPLLEEQIAMEPFTHVIAIPTLEEMIGVHTTTAELYGRKWCVLEMDEALANKVKITPAFSTAYQKKALSGDIVMEVDTEKAECGKPSDEERINKLILAKEGGFTRLNKVVEEIRQKFMVMEVEIELPKYGDLGIVFSGKPLKVEEIEHDSPLADKIAVGMVVDSFKIDDAVSPQLMDHTIFHGLLAIRHCFKKCVVRFINPNECTSKEEN